MRHSYVDIENVNQSNFISTILRTTIILFILLYWVNAVFAGVACGILVIFTLMKPIIVKDARLYFTGIDILILAYATFAFIPAFLHGEYESYSKVVAYPCAIFFIFRNIVYNRKILATIVFATLISTSIVIVIMYFPR